MRWRRETAVWLALAIAAVVGIVRLYPSVLVLVDTGGSASRAEVVAIALERLRDLGPPVEDPYVVVHFANASLLERRLQRAIPELGRERVRESWLARQLVRWEVVVYGPGTRPGLWPYRARLDRDGNVVELRRQVPEEEVSEPPTEAEAEARARRYLAEQGIDLGAFDSSASFRRDEVGERVDLRVRFHHREALFGDGFPYGYQVFFAGAELAGFGTWWDDPAPEQVQREIALLPIVFIGSTVLYFALVIVLAVPFLRRYHDGQLGVRRGLQFFVLCLVLGFVAMVLMGRGTTEGTNFGVTSRQATTWVMTAILYVFNFLTLAAISLMAWSVGEHVCRQRWPEKLAAVDALFRGRWDNATVARASVRGLAAGLAGVAAMLLLLTWLGPRSGAWPPATFAWGDASSSAVPALAWLGTNVAIAIPVFLLAVFLVPALLMRRFGPNLGAGLALGPAALATLGLSFVLLPIAWTLAVSLVVAMVGVATFRFGDLLSALLAGATMAVLPSVLPALFGGETVLAVHGWAAVLALCAPLIASVRHLGTGDEFVYTYDDVPPHVRRIAERERQRVELETARGIQSSILPELPPQLAGVEIAHAYLPATEVGGDFYDVLALEDGRLAVAVGDVAGHGVSSGLVMSMAKSALAVQVTFDPAVAAVLATLNRMVYQSARARLLTTLCYALVDPARRELVYSSAGHLFPYRVAADGEVVALEAGAYPLGVRGHLEASVRTARLAAGDTIFLYSDGLVEACPEGDDEPYGFERLEASLARHAGLPPQALRDAVLADVEDYTGGAAREDDLTVLVLRLPAA